MTREIEERLAKEIEKKVGVADVTIRKIKKNNGIELTSVTIKEPGMRICPNVYIDELVDRLENGTIELEDAAMQVANIYNHGKNNDEIVEINDTLNGLSREKILQNVNFQLVNTEKNKEMLQEIPHKEFLDLSIIYRYIVQDYKNKRCSFVISNNIMDCFGIFLEELDAAARKNTYYKKFEVKTMAETISQLLREKVQEEKRREIEKELSFGPPMYVMTNERHIEGASIMLYPEYFEKLADELKDDLFILPSSIHECLAVPASITGADELRTMVREVNMYEMEDEEILSDNVYRWSRENHQLSIVLGKIVKGNFR